jgi:hypothetical protein
MSPQPPRDRSSMLTIGLTFFLAAGILLFLILVSGGFFLYVSIGVIIIFLVGYLHYTLWGKNMMQNTAGEREEAQLQQERESDPW